MFHVTRNYPCGFSLCRKTKDKVISVTGATAVLLVSPFRKTPVPGAALLPRVPKAHTDDTPPATGFSFWSNVTTTSKKEQLREVEDQNQRRRLLGLPDDDVPHLDSLTPMHLKSPPPDPWSVAVKSSGKVSHIQ